MLKTEQGPGHAGMLANLVPKAAITALRGLTCCGCDKCLAEALAAALKAWPGMDMQQTDWERWKLPFPLIILPLPPQEQTDDR